MWYSEYASVFPNDFLVEAEDSPLYLQLDARGLGHIKRFRRTPWATYLLLRFLNLSRTHIGRLASRFHHLIGPPFTVTQARPPQASCPLLKARAEIPGLGRNSPLLDTVLRLLARSCIDDPFSNLLRLFTDASVDSGND